MGVSLVIGADEFARAEAARRAIVAPRFLNDAGGDPVSGRKSAVSIRHSFFAMTVVGVVENKGAQPKGELVLPADVIYGVRSQAFITRHRTFDRALCVVDLAERIPIRHRVSIGPHVMPFAAVFAHPA